MVYGSSQKCNFLIGPSSSWFCPSNSDTWTQPKGQSLKELNNDDVMDCCDETARLSDFIFGSIGCFCYGEIHHYSAQMANIGNSSQSENANSLSAALSHLIDIKEDNSRVVCTRFLKVSRRPLAMILTENGSLLVHDCISNQVMVHFKKSELLTKFSTEPEMQYEETISEHSNKKQRFDSMHQFSSCLWPNAENAFLGVSLPKKKTIVVFRLKLLDLTNVDAPDTIQKNDFIKSYTKLDLELPRFASPICCMDSLSIDDNICLVAIAMDDGLIVVVKFNFEQDRAERVITLARHKEQISSLSFLNPSNTKIKCPLGLLASASRDGLVVVWDIESESYFAYHTVSVDDGRKQRGTKINWFALKFIASKSSEQIYLAISNSNNSLTTLKIPKEKPRTSIKLETKEKHQKRQFGAQQILGHHGVIFNICFDSITQTLMTTSIDGSLLLWKCCYLPSSDTNDDNVTLELKPEFIYPTMSDNSRTHMMRHSPIRTDFLGLALGKGGVKFYKISENHIDNRFDMNASCSEIGRKITKAALTPTSIVWHPNKEYRLAIGTLEGKVLRIDIIPRKATLVETENKVPKKSRLTDQANTIAKASEDIFDVEYEPLNRDDSQIDRCEKKLIEQKQTDGVYSISWGPNPCCPQDITKFAIYAIGSISHRLFIYESYSTSKKENGDEKEKLTDYLDEFLDQSLPEAIGEASEVAWKSSMDLMALGTTTGKIIIVNYLDESHADRSRNNLFQKLAVIQGPLGHTYIQCLSWHPTNQEDDPHYYYIAASANESPAFIFNIKECVLVADVKTKLRIHKASVTDVDNTEITTTNTITNYVHKLDGHKKPISDIAWSPHKPDELATSSFDKYSFVWTLDNPSEPAARITSKFAARHRLFTIEWSLVDQDLIYTSVRELLCVICSRAEEFILCTRKTCTNVKQTHCRLRRLSLANEYQQRTLSKSKISKMNESKAYEAGSGGIRSLLADPLSWATKPPVIFKFASALLSLIIYSCVSAAWYDGRCLFNNYSGVCRFGSLTLISFLACVTLLVLEIMFNYITSVKVRRRIAIGDVIFSGINTIFYLLLFVFLAIAWLKSDYPPFGHSINCCRIAILLSFLAIFALAACTGLAYVRYQSGADTQSQFFTEEQLAQEQAQYYDEAGNYIGSQQATGGANYSIDPSQYSTGNYMTYDTDININQ